MGIIRLDGIVEITLDVDQETGHVELVTGWEETFHFVDSDGKPVPQEAVADEKEIVREALARARDEDGEPAGEDETRSAMRQALETSWPSPEWW